MRIGTGSDEKSKPVLRADVGAHSDRIRRGGALPLPPWEREVPASINQLIFRNCHDKIASRQECHNTFGFYRKREGK